MSIGRKPLYNRKGHCFAKYLAAEATILMGDDSINTDSEAMMTELREKLPKTEYWSKLTSSKARVPLLNDAEEFLSNFSKQKVNPEFKQVNKEAANTLLRENKDLKVWYDREVKTSVPTTLFYERLMLKREFEEQQTAFALAQKDFDSKMLLIDCRLASKRSNVPRDEAIQELLTSLKQDDQEGSMDENDGDLLGSEDDSQDA